MQKLQKILYLIFIVVVVLSLICFLVSVIGGLNFRGCVLRYSNSDSSVITQTSNVTLKSTANYTLATCTTSEGEEYYCNDTSSYGQWIKSEMEVIKDSEVQFNISGEVSLCKSYYPGTSIAFPRVDDFESGGSAVLLNANTNSWQHVIQVFRNDKVEIAVGNNYNDSNIQVTNLLNSSPISANCSDGQTSYSPICGKYSFYSNSYVTKCASAKIMESYYDKPTCFEDVVCCVVDALDEATKKCKKKYSRQRQIGTKYFAIERRSLPLPYKDTLLDTHTENIGEIDNQLFYFEDHCPSLINPDEMKTWFSFDSTSGEKKMSALLYEISDTYSTYKVAELIEYGKNRKIFDQQIFDSVPKAGGYLRYKFYNSGTGGYVIYVKHTKCYRKAGESFSDAYSDRGMVKYLLLDSKQDPNVDLTLASSAEGLSFDLDGTSNKIVPSKDGYFWLLINNKPEDYIDSTGTYDILITQKTKATEHTTIGGFWQDIVDFFINQWKDAGEKIFQNLTCYGADDTSDCYSLFMYIKATLILYIMLQGALFTLGASRINALDFVIHIIKIVCIGGLINGATFKFFSAYIFPLIYNATNSVMANFIGYDLGFASSMAYFINEIYKQFGNELIWLQILALLSSGGLGFVMMLLVLLSVIIFIIPVIEFIVLYFFASIILSFLISLTPFFLVFFLFDVTRYMFDFWIKTIFKYIFEPVILFCGIVIFQKLFFIYLDYVLNYSVCWKCIAPVTIPFIGNYFPLLKSLATYPVFCIYWFAPWGFDPIRSNFILPISNIVSLVIIAMGVYKYQKLVNEISFNIFSTFINQKTYGQSGISKMFNFLYKKPNEKLNASSSKPNSSKRDDPKTTNSETKISETTDSKKDK